MSTAVNAIFGADSTNFQRELSKMERGVTSFGGLVRGALGAIGIGSFGALESSIMTLGKSLKDSADRLGVTTDEIQQLNFAADEAGSSLARVAQGLDRLAVAKEAALSGSKEGEKLVMAFNHFGISVDQIRALTPKELFDAIGGSISKTGVNAKVTANSIALMGRSGSQLIPILKNLAENYDKYEHNSLKLSKGDIEGIDAAARAWTRLGTGIKMAAAESQIGLSYLFKGDTWAKIFYPSLADNPAQAKAISELRDKLAVQATVNAPLPDYTVHGNEVAATRDSGRGMKEIGTRRLELAEKLFRNSLKMMSVTEKKAALEKEIAKHESAAAFYESVGDTEADASAAQEKSKAEDLRGQLIDVEKGGSKRGPGVGYRLNAQQQIGAYAVALPDFKIQTEHLKKIVENTDHLKPKANNSPPGTRRPQLGPHPNS